MANKIPKKQQILQVLADILEKQPNKKITVKLIATEVGFTEAALYRHFPSKLKMYSELLDFIEESLFKIFNEIDSEGSSIVSKIENILSVYLGFAEKNPGLSRLITGEALAEEDERLYERMVLFSEKIEMKIKHILREYALENIELNQSVASTAKVLHSVCEGLVLKYNRSNFKNLPTDEWQETWENLKKVFFKTRN